MAITDAQESREQMRDLHWQPLPEPPNQEKLCDGCNVQGNWEHRCHGKGCDCDSPVCMEKQGKITHKELMEIVNNQSI